RFECVVHRQHPLVRRHLFEPEAKVRLVRLIRRDASDCPLAAVSVNHAALLMFVIGHLQLRAGERNESRLRIRRSQDANRPANPQAGIGTRSRSATSVAHTSLQSRITFPLSPLRITSKPFSNSS